MKGDVWLCLLHPHFCLGPRAVGLLALAGGGDFDECAEALFVEAGAGVVLGEDAFDARVVAREGDHGGVHGLPIVGSLADPWRWDQRASAGTQKTFSALYCSAPPRCPVGLPAAGCLAPLGSAASMLLRSLSAVSQSLASKPMVAVDWDEAEDLVRTMGEALFPVALVVDNSIRRIFPR
jgi:hypothetical protein